LFTGFHLSLKRFAVRGFLVVLFYIMFDVVSVCMMVDSGTAHWAHASNVVIADRLPSVAGDLLSA
jgi:hypothetical protein